MNCLRRPIVAVLSALVIGAAAVLVVGVEPASTLAAIGARALALRIDQEQRALERERSVLLATRDALARARRQLARVEDLQSRAESALGTQVRRSYESDRADIVTVVLEAHGFADLLERVAFDQRLGAQDARVVARARAARQAVAARASALGMLEARQQTVAAAILVRRNELTATRVALAREQIDAARARRAREAGFSGALARLTALQKQLSKARAQQEAAGAGSGSGRFAFPLPKSAAAPPSTWSLAGGVDIAAPGGTPEFAVCSGTIVLHGMGGFGPWTPVLRCDMPLAGYGYVYYGHAGPGNAVAVGTHVGAGAVIGEVGTGIVGASDGPHLELGFADGGGAPVGRASAGRMLSLLRSAY
jgi:murein DD-endopeptidase MepM/ murein hydrolase activator NlpD